MRAFFSVLCLATVLATSKSLSIVRLVSYSLKKKYFNTKYNFRPLDNQCLAPHKPVQWKLRQDLSVDRFTALKAFQDTFSNTKLPNFAGRAMVDVKTFKPLSRKSWKVYHARFT